MLIQEPAPGKSISKTLLSFSVWLRGVTDYLLTLSSTLVHRPDDFFFRREFVGKSIRLKSSSIFGIMLTAVAIGER